MSEYTHRRDELKLTIDEAAILKGHAVVRIAKDGRGYAILVDAAERQAAAQALAGDGYKVIPVVEDQAVPQLDPGDEFAHLRDVIDPADVKVGDVVEVAISGTVTSVGEIGFVLEHRDDANDAQIPFDSATVRLVRRAEPEPDPEHIKALEAVLDDAGCGDEDNHSLARELIRRGVTVQKER